MKERKLKTQYQIVKDFLYHCFQKDPHLRISAKKLLKHPWMLSARRNLEPAPAPIRPDPYQDSKSGLLSNGISTHAKLSSGAGGTIRPKKVTTVYDEAVLRVQEWNEALNGMCRCLLLTYRI